MVVSYGKDDEVTRLTSIWPGTCEGRGTSGWKSESPDVVPYGYDEVTRLTSIWRGTPAAVQCLCDAFVALRTDPWIRSRVVKEALLLAQQLEAQSPENSSRLFEAVFQPFCVTAREISRLEAMTALAAGLPSEQRLRAVAARGRWTPWDRAFLEFRLRTYAEARDPRLAQAHSDLDTFLALSGRTFLESMAPSAKR